MNRSPKISTHILRIATTMYRWVFPKEIKPNTEIYALLQGIYPTIDWQKVRFYEGLPWFMNGNFANAIVLPATWHTHKIHAYFANYQPSTPSGLSTIIHEGFHVLQYQDLGKGFGFLRGFMVCYLAEYFQLFFKNIFEKGHLTANQIAYDQHPMETPAFRQDSDFRQYCLRNTAISPTQLPLKLVHKHCGYTPKIAFPFLLAGLMTTLTFTIIKPLIEISFLIIATPIYIIGRILKIISL